MKKVAILVFPGMNCEVETYRALTRTGWAPQIILWNEDQNVLNQFDAVVLPGGFSFEDRGRSGVVASKEPICDVLHDLSAQGKPILGICNGAQVVVESGLLGVDMALARNKRISAEGDILGTGFYHSWVYIKNTTSKNRSAFNNFNEILHLPVAHGEGRFIADKDTLHAIQKNEMNLFSYCDQQGEITDNFPVNPNGSALNMAGVCNANGNVLALMPHPERTFTCDAIFKSMYDYVGGEKKQILMPKFQIENSQSIEHQIEFFVSLKITDNTEKTMEKALQKVMNDDKLKLKRQIFWGIKTQNSEPLKLALKIAQSGEIFNENKEQAIVEVNGQFFKYEQGKLKPIKYTHSKHSFLAMEKEDFIGQEKFAKISHHLGSTEIEQISNGVLWSVSSEEEISEDDIHNSKLFTNPVSGDLYQIV